MLGGVLPKSRCRFLHLDLGNTEVVPWDLGKKMPMSVCRNLHVDIGNSLTIILYHDFSRNGFGVLHLRFRQKKSRSFGSGDPKSIAPANPSHNNILFYILSKYSTKKNISELRSNGDRLFWLVLPRVEGQMDGEANYQSPSWHDYRIR